jgi:hypothetical protein
VRKIKFLLIILVSVVPLYLFLNFSSISASSDEFDYMFSTCEPGEMEISCRYDKRLTWLGENEGCKKYETNTNYRYLTGKGAMWQGIKAYCYSPSNIGGPVKESFDQVVGYLSEIVVPLILLVLLVELPVFFALGFKTRKAAIGVTLINFITVPLVKVVLLLLPVAGFLIFLPAAIFVILFEAGFLSILVKGLSVKRIFYSSALANTMSAVIGYTATVVFSLILT